MPSKLAKILDQGTYVMSNLTRIYIQFPTVFWDNEAEAFLASSNEGPGEFPEFRNENHKTRVPGSKTLLGFIGNPESVKYENMHDEQVQAAVVKKLKELFGDDKVPEPSAFYMTRWGTDPLAYGCYSAMRRVSMTIGLVENTVSPALWRIQQAQLAFTWRVSTHVMTWPALSMEDINRAANGL